MFKKNKFLINVYKAFLFIIFIVIFPILILKYLIDFVLSKFIYFRKGNFLFKNFFLSKPVTKKVKFNDITIKVLINSFYDAWRIGNYKNFFINDIIEDAANDKLSYYDVGANTGFSSIIISKKLLDKIETFAIEIEPANFKTLCDNILINNLKNIHPINLGISDKTKITKFFYNKLCSVEKNFFYPLSSVGLHSTKFVKELHDEKIYFNTMMFKFDDLIEKFDLPKPTHIFVDAYGSEKEIMMGMEKSLSSKVLKKIYLDIEDDCKYIEETWIFKYLKSKNFKIKELIVKHHIYAKSNWNAIFEKLS
jgi:FkbM family methyltransferase